MRIILALPLVLLTASTSVTSTERSVPVTQQGAVPITEWKVPWERTRPRDPFMDGKGRVWFVGQEGNYVAVLDPASGKFQRHEIQAGTNPHNLIVDAAGNVWYSGNRNGRIGRIDATSGKITIYMMPDPSARDPHTLVFDHEGDIWFTVQGGNFVGHLATKTGKIRLAKSPTAGSRPYGIVINSKDEPWFVEFGTNKVATIDRTTMRITEHTLPDAGTHPRRIAVTSDDVVWYTDYTRGMLGRFDPKTAKTAEWTMPAGKPSLPYALGVDDRDRLWVAETGIQPNRLAVFDSKTSSWASVTPIAESGGGTVRHMSFNRPTRTMWFGTDANTIARVRVP
jgi:virginiamycin B lyase